MAQTLLGHFHLELPATCHLARRSQRLRRVVQLPGLLSGYVKLFGQGMLKVDLLAAQHRQRDTGSAPAIRTAIAPQDERDLAARHRAFLTAATSHNTRQAYRSAIKHYLDWGGVLPADEPAVIRYLVRYADALNPRTLALRMTALSQWHVHQGFADPAATSTVRKTLAGIARTNGRPKKKAKALPIEDLELIVATLASACTLKAARDNALLQVGFFGGFRRSELVGIEVDHIAWDAQGITVTLPRSKTDQTGEGVTKAIPYSAGPCCPATALRAWLDVASVASRPGLPVDQ